MTQKAKVGQHMSVCDLADILKLIGKEPMTARQASCLHKLGLTHMRKVLRHFVQMGLARVVGWDVAIRGTPPAIFAAGGGESVPAPMTKEGEVPKTAWGRGGRTRANANTVLFCEIVKALDGGATIADVVERSGCSPSTAGKLINHMHQQGLVHVCAWDAPVSGYPVRVFAMGARRDAPRPKAMTKREKSLRQYYARKAKTQQAAMLHVLAGPTQAQAREMEFA